MAYYVLIHSVTAYFLMLWSNKFIDASIISAYSTFQPVATTVLAILFLHEVGVWLWLHPETHSRRLGRGADRGRSGVRGVRQLPEKPRASV